MELELRRRALERELAEPEPPGPTPIAPDTHAKVLELYDKGHSVRAISRITGVTRPRVTRMLERTGRDPSRGPI